MGKWNNARPTDLEISHNSGGFFTLNIYFQTKRKIVDVFTSGSGTADPSAAHELFPYF